VKAVVEAIVLAIVVLFLPVIGEPVETAKMISKWDFEGISVDQSPAGFTFGRTGSGRLGRWLVKAETMLRAGLMF
jgi:hypothetical protein